MQNMSLHVSTLRKHWHTYAALVQRVENHLQGLETALRETAELSNVLLPRMMPPAMPLDAAPPPPQHIAPQPTLQQRADQAAIIGAAMPPQAPMAPAHQEAAIEDAMRPRQNIVQGLKAVAS